MLRMFKTTWHLFLSNMMTLKPRWMKSKRKNKVFKWHRRRKKRKRMNRREKKMVKIEIKHRRS